MSMQWVHNVAHVRLNQALLLQQHSSTAVTRFGRRTRYVGHSCSSRQGVMKAGCGGRDIMYLRLQPLYLGPLTAVNNLATGLNWQRSLLEWISVFVLSLHRKRKCNIIFGRKRKWPKPAQISVFGTENENEIRSDSTGCICAFVTDS